MTNEQALDILEHNWTKLVNPDCTDEELGQALDLAIKALEERPQSEWVNDSDNLPICNICGEVALQRIFVKFPHLIQDVRMVRSNFCPNCGAKMQKDDAE